MKKKINFFVMLKKTKKLCHYSSIINHNFLFNKIYGSNNNSLALYNSSFKFSKLFICSPSLFLSRCSILNLSSNVKSLSSSLYESLF